MIPIHINKIKGIQESIRFKDEIKNQREVALQNLQNLRQLSTIQDERNYLDRVIQLFTDAFFLLKTPEEIEVIKINMIPLPALRLDNTGRSLKKQLTHEIQEALKYTQLRKDFYPKYFREIGIKACVYCNSQLTIVLVKNKYDFDARLEVDHHYPKNEYPYLSISLFNLYPCCSSCNKRKSATPVNFYLYSDDILKFRKSEYYFEISSKSKCSYLLSKDIDNIDIIFNDSSVLVPGKKSLQNIFSVKEIHDTQKDLISELIIKSQIYNDNFKKLLQNNFLKLSLSQKDFERVIVGNYTEEKDIHKRPFSKIMMDIARQLDLI